MMLKSTISDISVKGVGSKTTIVTLGDHTHLVKRLVSKGFLNANHSPALWYTIVGCAFTVIRPAQGLGNFRTEIQDIQVSCL